MTKIKVYILVLLGCTLLVIYYGQVHWKQNLQEVALISQEIIINHSRVVGDKEQELGTNSVSHLLYRYETSFSEVIINYQQEVQLLYEKAETDYYENHFLEQSQFRNFITTYIDEVDQIYQKAKIDYEEIYNALNQDLQDNGYKYNDTFLYYIVFEEMTMNTHTNFVTQLINLSGV